LKKYKKIISIFILITLLLNFSGCSAYTEINDLPLVLGAAIDKEYNGNYILTVEVFKPTTSSKQKDAELTTEIFQTEGITIFDAIRDLIIKLGKRAYWTHLKCFIVSKDIAAEGISPVLDMFSRNAHIRKEFPVLISNDKTAYGVFYKGKQTYSEPVSIFINNTIKSVDKISKYDYIKFYELIDDITTEGKSAVLPLISMNPIAGKKIASVYGLAVFKKDKIIRPKTFGQRKVLEKINHNDILFVIGPAGSGKTYLAVALAISSLKKKEVERIILIRPAVEAGESLGFLPGDLMEKIDPYFRPLYDAIYEMMPSDKFQNYIERGIIEVAPLAYMRGRTLNNSFIILDDAQNTTLGQMKMFLTRFGFGSKIIVTGDVTQIDLPQKTNSGLIKIAKILNNIKGIEFVYLEKKDVIRHRLVREIIRAYENEYNQIDKIENNI